MLKVVFISDTHGYHKSLNIPKCDLLVCSGDLSKRGEIEIFESFNKWVGKLKSDNVIQQCVVIPGNHDLSTDPKFLRYYQPNYKSYFTNCIFLVGESFEFEQLKIYGDPRTPEFCGWGHSYNSSLEAQEIWSKIPSDTNLLITHGPPYGMLDMTFYGQKSVGCFDLRERINQLDRLAVHCFGHIHEQYGFTKNGDKLFINASSCSLQYSPVNRPIVVQLSNLAQGWVGRVVQDYL